MNRLRTIATLLLLLIPLGGTAWGQGTRKDDIVLNRFGQPVAGATVTVCTSGATGTPCSPLAAIFSDVALTQAKANPFTTDGQGNYNFYAAPGRYKIQISGAGVTTTTIPDVLLAADPATPSYQSLNVSQGITAFSLNLGGNLGVTGSVSSTTSLSAPQTGNAAPVQVGPHWYPGMATGLVTPPQLACATASDSASGGSITAGTYYFKITYGNKNGETTASPSCSVTVAGSTNRIKVAANNDLNWLTGAYKMRVYASNDNANFYPQTAWSPTFNIASPGGCVRASNVVTCTVASGVFGLTPQQTVTVANVPNGTTSFNGTFTVTAVNITSTTFSYAQIAANDTSGTGTGTVSYSTAIDTNWAYVGDGGGNDVVFSAFTFSGTQPPSTNTATIDPIQVAVNAAFTQPPFVGFNLREGAVQLDGKAYTLTTPLVCGHSGPEIRGQTGQVGIEGDFTGAGVGTQILSSWSDVNTGTVMAMSKNCAMRNVTLVGTGDTNAYMVVPGFQDTNGGFLNGVTFQINS